MSKEQRKYKVFCNREKIHKEVTLNTRHSDVSAEHLQSVLNEVASYVSQQCCAGIVAIAQSEPVAWSLDPNYRRQLQF